MDRAQALEVVRRANAVASEDISLHAQEFVSRLVAHVPDLAEFAVWAHRDAAGVYGRANGYLVSARYDWSIRADHSFAAYTGREDSIVGCEVTCGSLWYAKFFSETRTEISVYLSSPESAAWASRLAGRCGLPLPLQKESSS
jgi:hypothetical protein